MDESTPEALRRNIAATHEDLKENISALQTKAKELTDWRAQFDQHPLAMLGLAAGGGMIAAAILGVSRRRRGGSSVEYRPAAGLAPVPERQSERQSDGAMHRLGGALGAVAASAALDLLYEAVPGIKERLVEPVRQHMAKAAPRAQDTRQEQMPLTPARMKGFNGPRMDS